MNKDLAAIKQLDAVIAKLSTVLLSIASNPDSGDEYKVVLRLLDSAHAKRAEIMKLFWSA